MTNPTDGAMPALPEPSFEYPSLCRFNGNEMESYAKAYAAPLVARVAELEADAAELAFLAEDLLYWVDRAVSKGNANSDIEEAYERYEQWQRARAALAAKEQP